MALDVSFDAAPQRRPRRLMLDPLLLAVLVATAALFLSAALLGLDIARPFKAMENPPAELLLGNS